MEMQGGFPPRVWSVDRAAICLEKPLDAGEERGVFRRGDVGFICLLRGGGVRIRRSGRVGFSAARREDHGGGDEYGDNGSKRFFVHNRFPAFIFVRYLL